MSIRPLTDLGAWLAFGPFRLDPRGEELFCGQNPIKLRGKTMAVLRYLVERGGIIVSREELMAAIWPDVTVQSETLATSIAELRRVFGDSRSDPKYIETRHGHGFRFVAPVRILRAVDVPRAPSDLPRAFIGRAQEFTQLQRRLEQAMYGQTAHAIVWGPAGIGKTCLLEQFTAYAERIGAHVFWGRGAHTSEHSTFWMWTQVIRAFAEVSPAEGLSAALGRRCRHRFDRTVSAGPPSRYRPGDVAASGYRLHSPV